MLLYELGDEDEVEVEGRDMNKEISVNEGYEPVVNDKLVLRP